MHAVRKDPLCSLGRKAGIQQAASESTGLVCRPSANQKRRPLTKPPLLQTTKELGSLGSRAVIMALAAQDCKEVSGLQLAPQANKTMALCS